MSETLRPDFIRIYYDDESGQLQETKIPVLTLKRYRKAVEYDRTEAEEARESAPETMLRLIEQFLCMLPPDLHDWAETLTVRQMNEVKQLLIVDLFSEEQTTKWDARRRDRLQFAVDIATGKKTEEDLSQFLEKEAQERQSFVSAIRDLEVRLILELRDKDAANLTIDEALALMKCAANKKQDDAAFAAALHDKKLKS